MPQPNLLDDVADMARDFLGQSRSHQELQKYSWQLKTICELIRHTHSLVVSKLDAIEETTSVDSARELASQLEEQPLEDSFRANGLCDLFEGYGRGLRRITVASGQAEGAKDELQISGQHQPSWFRFIDTLEERESEVAALYAYEIQEIGDLVAKSRTREDLDKLKAAAGKARSVLTTQMADFDSLASQFQLLIPAHD